MKKLCVFSPYELRLILCGEQAPSWTKGEVLKYTEPKYGYTKERSAQAYITNYPPFPLVFVLRASVPLPILVEQFVPCGIHPMLTYSC